jgi:hypothetical protein
VDWLPSLALGVHLAKEATIDPAGESDIASLNPDNPEILMLIAPEPGPAAKDLDRKIEPIRLPMELIRDMETAVIPHRKEILLGAQATEERLLHDSLKGVRVLLLFAHGANRKRIPASEITVQNLDAYIERPATLVLSPSEGSDGLLGPDEVEGMQAPPLVVLSACLTASGPVRYGDDGINHLGGAFFQAGANTVLLTPSNLEVRSTAVLTARLLDNVVRRGLSPAKALKDARRTVAASRGWEHPFHHSMLQVMGLGHRPMFDKEKARPREGDGLFLFVLSGGLLALAVAAALLYRRSRGSSG